MCVDSTQNLHLNVQLKPQLKIYISLAVNWLYRLKIVNNIYDGNEMYMQHFRGNDGKASSTLKSANSVYYQKTCTSIFHLDVILNIFTDKNLNQKTAFDADTFSCNKSFK